MRDADVDRGRSQALHDLVWRRMAVTEEERGFADLVAATTTQPPE